MKIALGADHAGFELKQYLADILRREGHDVLDLGTDNCESVDYPDYAEKVAVAVVEKTAERGVMICGSGVGAAIAANKITGIRAGLCHDTYSAHQCVEHDDVNMLVMGGRVVGPLLAAEILQSFIAATFSGDERHQRRLNKVKLLESREKSHK